MQRLQARSPLPSQPIYNAFSSRTHLAAELI